MKPLLTNLAAHDNPNAAQIDTWTQWDIDLQAFADQGVNLANVNTIGLGLGNKNNPQADGTLVANHQPVFAGTST
ncbi:MAG: hypothetical protein ACFFCW_20050 [Candidatus Hodarchaeota archaeon]